MKVSISIGKVLEQSCKVLVIGCFENEPASHGLENLDSVLGGVVKSLYVQKEFGGKFKTSKLIHTLDRFPAERILLVGLGKRSEFTVERLRQASGTAAQALKSNRISSASTILYQSLDGSGAALEAEVTGYLLGSYAFYRYKSEQKDLAQLSELKIVAPTKKIQELLIPGLQRAVALCSGVTLARDLVSEPGNVATPEYLAEQALLLAGGGEISCTIHGLAAIEQLGMGGLLAVAKGSRQEPRFIALEYNGAGAGVKPVVLVGKGVTFDAGGISLKPREGMEAMKNDMAGAAAVLGVFKAAAAMELSCNIVGLIPAAENLPDGGAYKPGDVIKMMSGKTVEINNTDAEGRMILADALHYAERFNPAAVIDLATLTGACVVALGHHAAGLLGNDDRLKRALLKAGENSGERLWELPLWEEYGDAMKSDIADMKNAGGSYGGSITAGWFLQQFVGKRKWAHLDIAGTAWEEKGRHYLPKGASGFGVRLIMEYLRFVAK